MLILTAYMDETGHSKDERQKFNGMGGLLTKEENWTGFEREWDKILKFYKIPYIHMKEARTLFAGWTDNKKKSLSADVWKLIKLIEALPIGSIVPMDDYRPLESELKQYISDPYFIAMQDCMMYATTFVREGPFDSGNDPRVAMVFSEQVEFKYEGMRMYDEAIKQWKDVKKNLVDPPAYRDMKRVTPLQAADMVAYEIYKEYERVYYRLKRKTRYGYEQLTEIMHKIFKNPWLGPIEFIQRHSEHSLKDILEEYKQKERTEQYWKNKKKEIQG